MSTINIKNAKIQDWGNSYIIRVPKAYIDNGMLEVDEIIPLIEIHRKEK